LPEIDTGWIMSLSIKSPSGTHKVDLNGSNVDKNEFCKLVKQVVDIYRLEGASQPVVAVGSGNSSQLPQVQSAPAKTQDMTHKIEAAKKAAVAVHTVRYERGLPNYPSGVMNLVLILGSEGFLIAEPSSSANFVLEIPHNRMLDISPAEMELGTLGRLFFEVKSNEQLEKTSFNLAFTEGDGQDRLVRFAMSDGWGDATKARYVAQLVEKAYPYRKLFKSSAQPAVPVAAEPDKEQQVFAKLEKLGDLHKKGIINEEEFQKKKAELLAQL
jgi:hypothetical protein